MMCKNGPMNRFVHPFSDRYASQSMQHIFSPEFKFTTWRKLWVALAECQKELGLSITQEQIDQMRNSISDIDYNMAAEQEKLTRHDVMAHIHTFAAKAPAAKPIIHLGATSAFVGDNTDLIQIRDAGYLLLKRLTMILESLSRFALEHKNLATLGYTHFQPAQCTTVGKRACLWLLELSMDFKAIERYLLELPFLGVKGTTGTQASFLSLFSNDHEKVKQLDLLVTRKMGFDKTVPVSGQTYSRKIDSQALAIISGMGQTCHKIANDLRLLQHLKEVEEPFEKEQVGSSAMPYKRNPMRCERMTGIARYCISLADPAGATAAEQWFERTLDDSACKRLTVPEAFLGADAMLILLYDICNGLIVYPAMIQKHLAEELPFMATENILMEAVKKGGDRQVLHERLRILAQEAGKSIKNEGAANNLLDKITADPIFNLSKDDLTRILNISDFIGRAPEQSVEFIHEYIDPLVVRGKSYGYVEHPSINI